jgi:hypothetical protein
MSCLQRFNWIEFVINSMTLAEAQSFPRMMKYSISKEKANPIRYLALSNCYN